MLHQELFFPAREVKIPHGNKDGEAGREEAEDVVHTVLVIAFAAGAFHEGIAAEFKGLLRDMGSNELTSHRGRDRIAVIVGIRLDGFAQPLFGKLLFGVDNKRGDAQLFSPLDTLLDFGFTLTDVNADSCQAAGVVFLLGEFDAERRVKAARVGEGDAVAFWHFD